MVIHDETNSEVMAENMQKSEHQKVCQAVLRPFKNHVINDKDWQIR